MSDDFPWMREAAVRAELPLLPAPIAKSGSLSSFQRERIASQADFLDPVLLSCRVKRARLTGGKTGFLRKPSWQRPSRYIGSQPYHGTAAKARRRNRNTAGSNRAGNSPTTESNDATTIQEGEVPRRGGKTKRITTTTDSWRTDTTPVLWQSWLFAAEPPIGI